MKQKKYVAPEVEFANDASDVLRTSGDNDVNWNNSGWGGLWSV